MSNFVRTLKASVIVFSTNLFYYRRSVSEMVVRRFNIDDLTRRALYCRSEPDMVGRRFHFEMDGMIWGLDIVGGLQ